jgi:hypothetical protein
MDFGEAGWEGVECIQLAQGKKLLLSLVITVMNFLVP